MKEAFARWAQGINVNISGTTIAILALAVSVLGFGLMVRAEIAALRAEIRADNAAFRAEMRYDFSEFKAETRYDNDAFKAEMRADNDAFKAEMRADNEEMRADIAAMRADLREIADALDVRLSAIELEQARMQGVISVLESQSAAKGSP